MVMVVVMMFVVMRRSSSLSVDSSVPERVENVVENLPRVPQLEPVRNQIHQYNTCIKGEKRKTYWTSCNDRSQCGKDESDKLNRELHVEWKDSNDVGEGAVE